MSLVFPLGFRPFPESEAMTPGLGAAMTPGLGAAMTPGELGEWIGWWENLQETHGVFYHFTMKLIGLSCGFSPTNQSNENGENLWHTLW